MIQLQTLVPLLNRDTSDRPIDSISLKITIQSALSIGSGGSSGSLADKPIIRNASGQFVIPGSHLKGRLRHECEKIVRALGWSSVCEAPQAATMCPRSPNQPDDHCLICQIFGNPSLPSRVLFDDCVCDPIASSLPEVLRPGVTINRRRRVAEDKKLYFLETSPQNANLVFAGSLQLQPGHPAQTIPLLLSGLSLIRALGGSKSSGLGWLTIEAQGIPELSENDWSQLLPKEGKG